MTSLDTAIDPAAFHALKDRIDVTDVLYRYASTIDSKDYTTLRSVLADDLWAQYGPMEPLVGADQVMSFIIQYTKTAIWQHHLLSVYHVDVDGDRAKALVYHTSRQMFEEDPETMNLLVARYHNELRREPSGWKISKLVFERVWAEQGKDETGFHATMGGPGPSPLP
jgi:ketosteroid isomerase-like protein